MMKNCHTSQGIKKDDDKIAGLTKNLKRMVIKLSASQGI
jgi:hypothetical protein